MSIYKSGGILFHLIFFLLSWDVSFELQYYFLYSIADTLNQHKQTHILKVLIILFWKSPTCIQIHFNLFSLSRLKPFDKGFSVSKPLLFKSLLCFDWSDDPVFCDWSRAYSKVSETTITISEFWTKPRPQLELLCFRAGQSSEAANEDHRLALCKSVTWLCRFVGTDDSAVQNWFSHGIDLFYIHKKLYTTYSKVISEKA